MELNVNYDNCPAKFQGGMRRYIENRMPGGHFLNAVLRNDLTEAVSHADSTSLQLLRPLVVWLYNEAPGECWGDEESFKNWVENKQEPEPTDMDIALELAESWINGNLSHVRDELFRTHMVVMREAFMEKGYSFKKAVLTCERLFCGGSYQEACDAD